MRKYFSLFSVAVFCLLSMTGCWTSIRTVAPTTEVVAPVRTVYVTEVTTPTPKQTTKTTFVVTNYTTDPSFYLDLNAVAAAFAESRSVREFEQIINSSRYMINNLDLNKDGWVDYLRVIETYRGVYHTLLIQACLAPGVFQDVATLVAEHRPDALIVEVIGDRWLYGQGYIVRPVFIKRPPMWDVYGHPTYAAWNSPYYYGSFPSYYTQPKPVYLNHYQAYVNTYMTNHHYCHRCDYPQQPFYNGYTQMTQGTSRNDYAVQYPNDAFERRVTRTASGSGVTVRNAGQLRTEVSRQQAAETKTTSQPTQATTRQSSSTQTTNTRSSQTSTQTKTQTTTQTTTQASSRGSQTTTQTTNTRSSQTSTTQRQPSTQVNTRVKSDGTTRTSIKTTDAQGRTTTVKRENPSQQRTSQPQSTQRTTQQSSSSSQRSSGTTTSSGSRTSGSSTTTTRR